MPMTNFPFGFQNGVSIQNIPIITPIPGNVFWVDSATGSNGANGTQNSPFATIDYAIGRCTANNGDVIFVKPGHAETVSAAAGIDFDVAGVSVIGLGSGSNRPTITMSATTSTIHMDAANCLLSNMLIVPTAAVVVGIDVDKADCTIHKCEFRGGATTLQFTDAIEIVGAGANACDRTSIIDCEFFVAAGVTDPDSAIELGEVADRITISGCVVRGGYDDAPIHNPTGKVLTNLLIKDCILENTQTGDHSLELVSACTGMLVRNMYKSDMTQATASDPGSCFSFECYHDDAIDTNGILSPVAT
ncbi:MAG: hypothetical protein HQL90_04250 [Magnetococcales bacterium]|nr:hypothetical protein [Magnetococcales bacterium]